MALKEPTGKAVGNFSVTTEQHSGAALSQERCDGVRYFLNDKVAQFINQNQLKIVNY